jgi:glyoxylase-like metal-dependent hydrolase (beta-lactamase superfamily II)
MLHRNVALHFASLAAAALLGTSVAAQQPVQPLMVKKLKDNIYVAEGGGGNSTIIVGDTGVIVIDAKISAAYGKEVVDEVAKITSKPITTVIETHSDGDHINGLPAFPKGVTVIAAQNNKMEQEQAAAAGGRGAPPKEAMPTKVVSGTQEQETIDGVQLQLFHIAPAHTSGDLAVYLPEEKLVATGDLVATTLPDPLIHLEKHGSSEGWIKFVSALVELDADTYVPGHGDPQTKAQVQERLKSAETKRTKIEAMVKEHKSLDEIKSELGEAVPAGGAAPRFPSFTETTYKELTAQ